MRHPAEHYLKFLFVRHPDWSDAQVEQHLRNCGILPPCEWDKTFWAFMHADLPAPPEEFDPLDITHRPSVAYLRRLGIYEAFRSTPEMEEALDILANPDQRLVVEQVILSRLELRMAALKINKRMGWFLSEAGINTYRHYFWNTKILTFDDWGKFLFGRASLYERHMALLQGDQRISLFHLRIEQSIESKTMIQRSQEIAYFTLEEVNLKPGTGPDKVKAIAVLTKAVVECHEALSTSDMALKDVLKQFERFRVHHPQALPPDIKFLAPLGNYTGGGSSEKDPLKN